MEQELLQDLKDYLGDDYDESSESALLICIKRAINSCKINKNDRYISSTPLHTANRPSQSTDMTGVFMES